jgi:hypothetical protein
MVGQNMVHIGCFTLGSTKRLNERTVRKQEDLLQESKYGYFESK